jgi:hypothetical protein
MSLNTVRIAAAFAAVLLSCTFSPSALGAKWVTGPGVQYYSNDVFRNQLSSSEVVSFPRGCDEDECDFTIHLDKFTDGSCHVLDKPLLSFNCEYRACILWAEFHSLPRTAAGRDGEGVHRLNLAPIGNVDLTLDYALPFIQTDEGREATWILRNYSKLRILSWEIEVTTNTCRAGFQALYVRDSKTANRRGLTLPFLPED